MMKTKFTVFLLVLLATSALKSQNDKELFNTDEVLELTLTFDEKQVYNDTKERELHQATVGWTDSDGSSSEIPIKMQTRGKTRAMKSTCRIPPLFLNFKGSETKDTPFHKQKKIKLVTHCKNSNSFKEFVKKEYIVYKLYNLISPYSFRVRLCNITYADSKKPEDSSTHYGFLLESIKDVGKRNDKKEYKGLIRNQEALDKDNLDKLVLFEYLIGNLDWSIPKRHNIKIMVGDDGSLPVGVPYDFDYSGLVDAPYAVPPEGMNISSVKTRLFRGLCRDQGYASQIQYYKSIQSKLIDEVKNAAFMDEKSRNDIVSYINEFYADISNPGKVKKDIDQACRAEHKHRYEY